MAKGPSGSTSQRGTRRRMRGEASGRISETAHAPALPRLAEMGIDHWCLRSGEAAHAASPETFWIPERADRDALVGGQAVKLIFDQEGYEETGEIIVQARLDVHVVGM